MTRATATSRDATAGCFVCHGGNAYWRGPNAQAVAARHHDSTKHATWCDVYMAIRYGAETVDPRQIDIEAAIAASSGGAALCAPLTAFDASAGTAADVSAPVGRTSKPALAAAPPESVSS